MGPYTVKFYNYKMCSGPRSRNVTISTSTLDIGEFGAIASYNCTFTEPAKVEEFKTIVWNVNGNQKNILWNYKVNKPCQHFVISGIMKQYFPTMRNCVVPPVCIEFIFGL
uniref:SFRICE_005221 n=1 Tax=Spodoptera frugiperda TaxID=7108 RepID=A0A2H1WD13_SPOFR